MADSPSRNAPYMHPPVHVSTVAQPSSPRSPRTLRKLQSERALSSQYSYTANNAPSLISQQRLQQHRSTANLRDSAGPLAHTPYTDSQIRFSARTRADSDLSANGMPYAAAAQKRGAMVKKPLEPERTNLKEEIETLMRQGPKGDVNGNLAILRRNILLDGLVADSDGMSQLRIYIWLILLNCPPLPTDAYLALIHRGPSPAYAKIRNDTFRTLATDPLFKRRVSEASLIRLLNALAWTLHDAHQIPQLTPLPPSPEQPSGTNPTTKSPPTTTITTTSATGSPSKHAPTPPLPSTDPPPTAPTTIAATPPSIYLQGLNVLSAPFLYAARSETQAYTLLTTLLHAHLPSYITPSLSGVHRGLALVDTCLALIDPKLAAHLAAHQLSASIYAFPSVLTLCACTPPLPEVLCLWDFLLAHGVHLNILAIVAQLVVCREELLGTERPGGVLGRGFPPLQGRRVVGLAVSFVGRVGEGVWREVVEHVR